MEEQTGTEPTPKASTLPAFPDVAWRTVFGEYRSLIENISECPLPFHFAAMLSTIAAEFGDRVRLAEGKATYPNFFIFCCGITGTKKSTATDLVRDYLTPFIPNREHAVLTSVSSAEGLIRTLRQRPNLLLLYDEVKDLFATSARSGQRIEPVLNSAFDLRRLEAVVKKTKDSLVATDYCFNLYGNLTPDHVRLDLSEAFFAGGLLNRFLTFAAEPTGRSIPIMGTPDEASVKDIAMRIGALCNAWRQLSPLRGSIRVGFSEEAQGLHAEWYHRHTLAMQKMRDIEAKPLTRLDMYTKKLAMVYCLLETAPTQTPMIRAEHMAAALAVVAYCQACMSWMTRSWSGPRSAHQQSEMLAEQRIEAYLRQKGCMSERAMYRNLHLSIAECGKTINELLKLGIVRVGPGMPRMLHYVETCTCFTEPPTEAAP